MHNGRRDFIKKAGVLAVSGAGIAVAHKVIADNSKPVSLGERTIHVLPDLAYAYEALEPYIDRETMETHHSKHHQAYVDGLNKAEEELSMARASGDFGLIEYWSKKAAFNGGGHALHSLFWKIMGPATKTSAKEPKGPLLKAISRDFGSFESFKRQFSAAAKSVEGSGWAILHLRKSDSRLIVLQAENQHKLATWDTVPILVLDVWEHAYYLKYRNQRANYVEAWWNIVNWDEVEKIFAKSV
ncbi:MAG TPA: superoxide dismutase [Oligoflexia bacterium]|nr:superoxide dismutase [Oligoflexia bacterium]HMP47792.1 superoxide dismutase [Oligoflexia bacterium]